MLDVDVVGSLGFGAVLVSGYAGHDLFGGEWLVLPVEGERHQDEAAGEGLQRAHGCLNALRAGKFR